MMSEWYGSTRKLWHTSTIQAFIPFHIRDAEYTGCVASGPQRWRNCFETQEISRNKLTSKVGIQMKCIDDDEEYGRFGRYELFSYRKSVMKSLDFILMFTLRRKTRCASFVVDWKQYLFMLMDPNNTFYPWIWLLSVVTLCVIETFLIVKWYISWNKIVFCWQM